MLCVTFYYEIDKVVYITTKPLYIQTKVETGVKNGTVSHPVKKLTILSCCQCAIFHHEIDKVVYTTTKPLYIQTKVESGVKNDTAPRSMLLERLVILAVNVPFFNMNSTK